MNNYKPYPKYKNSGIAWLGEIPEHWEVKRAKWVFKELSVKGFPNEPLLAATQTKGVVLKSKYENRTVVAQNNLETLKLVEPDDFVISLRSFQGGIELAHDRGIISPAYTVLRLKDQNQKGFFKYLLKSKEYINSLTLLVTGIREGQNIDTNKFKESLLFCPPKEEQTAIARFLDYKLAKINRFIQKKKQLIKLLNEQKAAIINQAVTKGLDPNAKMKDSGIEWLGEIPEHWEVRKLKYMADVVLGKMLCNEDKGGYFKKPYLKSKNIQWLNVDISDVEEMWFSNSELEMYRLKKGDLILSEGGEVGKTCMWNDELDECYIQNSAHKVKINSGSLNTYFLYLFNTYGKKGGFDSIVNRVSIAHLTKDKLINIKCLVPPLSEQQKIVSYIEQETEIINTTISKIEKELALTEEYKTALIAEAATGKIDVRGYEVPEISEEETYEEIEEEISMAAEDAEEYQIIEE
jgi:type I restriction enzyme, S subunit